MKKLIYLIALAMAGILFACHSDDGPKQPQELSMMPKELKALVYLSIKLKTQEAPYPSMWNPRDQATWGDNIRLDTVVDPDTNERVLVVSGITLYLPEPSYRISEWLLDFTYLKELKVYACPGATFDPYVIPYGCKTFVLEKINDEVPGRINIIDEKFNMRDKMNRHDWTFENFILHGTNATEIRAMFDLHGIYDVSDNLIDQKLEEWYFYHTPQVNLSYNHISESVLTWEEIIEQANIPNLQYNELEIPQWVTETEWWKTHHECFIGNPGYIAPAK